MFVSNCFELCSSFYAILLHQLTVNWFVVLCVFSNQVTTSLISEEDLKAVSKSIRDRISIVKKNREKRDRDKQERDRVEKDRKEKENGMLSKLHGKDVC